MATKLNDYEKQALASVALAAVAAVAMIVQAALILPKFNFADFEYAYSSKTLRQPIILGMTALAGIAAIAGILMGLNSAGQNRNKKQQMSWIGFFGNALVITITVVVFIMFWFAKEDIGGK